jgi:Winged helix-turn helix
MAMAQRRTIRLSAEIRRKLERMRDTAPQAYMRERAAAIVKIDEGLSPNAVAQSGLLRRHDADTVYRWLDRFEAEGVDGLFIRPGRGRKPAFSPSACDGGDGEGRGVQHHRA